MRARIRMKERGLQWDVSRTRRAGRLKAAPFPNGSCLGGMAVFFLAELPRSATTKIELPLQRAFDQLASILCAQGVQIATTGTVSTSNLPQIYSTIACC